jgi:tol-pal system protein YbgF
MSPDISRGSFVLRRFGVAVAMFGASLLTGCGGSEEATQQEQAEGQQPAAVQPEGKKEQAPMDQALTNFVGEKPPEKKPEPAKTEPAPTPAPQPSEMDKQLDELRTENTALKQKIVKLEQDGQVLNARLNEDEAKIAAEKDRADKAEEALKNASKAAPVPVVEEQKTAPAGNYDDALKAFHDKKYDQAAQMFKTLLDGGVAENLADNCTYWIGESMYAKKHYNDAIAQFEAVLKFKSSEKKADAQYMMAQCLERTGKKVDAKAAYEKVVKDYPMSDLVKKAKARWAKL